MRAWLLAMIPAAGCIDPGHFVCVAAAECGSGQCIAGSCVLDDDVCAFGRYSEYAAPELAGQCYVPEASGSDTTDAVSGSGTAAGETSDSSGAATSEGPALDDSSSGEPPPPLEACNGIDDDGDGLVDEWSPINDECELCPPDHECKPCELFPDDPDDPKAVYFLCHSGNYDEIVSFCTALGAPFASIHDDAENTRLTIKTAEFADYAKAYIGLRDLGEPGTPQWTWVDGSELDYERLDAEADAHPPDDTCVMIGTAGNWFTNHCNGGAPFFCKATLP